MTLAGVRLLGTAVLAVVLVAGCSKSPETPPAPTAGYLVATCMKGRDVDGAATDANKAWADAQVALNACQKYAELYPTGPDKNKITAGQGEAKIWRDYYANVVTAQELIEKESYAEARAFIAQDTGMQEFHRTRLLHAIEEGVSADLDRRFPGISPYAKQLHAKFGHLVTYRTAEAQQAVERFKIDCRAPDGRYLPLTNVLVAKIASGQGPRGMHMVIEADSRGDDVRIVDKVIDGNGREVYSRVGFELNKWGELRPVNITTDALYNACVGSHGPIWVAPS